MHLKSSRMRTLLHGCSALAFASSTFAQDATVPAGRADTPTQTFLEEIIVTANKREESLQDIPLAVTVVGSEQLAAQNVASIMDLARVVPSLGGTDSSGGAITIRGIGTISYSRSAESSVGTVLDGVALGNTSAVSPQIFDVARVEVLEGPQGMLFGRNASAGIVNITTVEPDPGAFGVVAHADVGSRNSAIAQAAVNLPTGDRSALRISAGYNLRPELLYNNHTKDWDQTEASGARARFKWELNDAVTVNLIGDYNKRDREGGAAWAVTEATATGNLRNQLTACGITVSWDNLLGCTDGLQNEEATAYGFSAQIDADLGFATLTSISAYRALETDFTGDPDSVPVNVFNQNNPTSDLGNFSQELRLTSPNDGFLTYVVGLYYFDSDQDYTLTQAGNMLRFLVPPGHPLGAVTFGRTSTIQVDNKSTAIFGQTTLNFTPSLRGIVGMRYGKEELTSDTTQRVADGAVAPAPIPGFSSLAPSSGGFDDTYFSYRLGGQYDFTDDAMFYLTYTRGYKAAAVNDAAPPGTDDIVKPEIPHAWEAGLKATLFGRMGLNLALFHTRATDFQTQTFDSANARFTFANAPELTSQGASINIFGRATDNLTLNAGVIYTDATYGPGFLVQCSQAQVFSGVPGCETFTSDTGATFRAEDVEGSTLPFTPKWKATASGEYSHGLTSFLDGYLQLDAVYTSSIRFSAVNDPPREMGSKVVLGGRLGVRTEDDRYGVSIYGRNLTDERVPAYIIPMVTSSLLADSSGPSYAQVFSPDSFRTYGVSFDVRF